MRTSNQRDASHPPDAKSRWRHSTRELLSLLTIAAVVLTARSSLADHYYVPSGSMQPTVDVDDHIVVNKLAYGLRVPLLDRYALRYSQPSRGDVVVLHSPDDGTILLKRVVAIPGDRVQVQSGEVSINGEPAHVAQHAGEIFEELGHREHPLGLTFGGGPDFGPVVVPDDRFLVLGDNRGNSKDGRFFGFVERSAIVGRAAGIFVRAGKITWIAL